MEGLQNCCLLHCRYHGLHTTVLQHKTRLQTTHSNLTLVCLLAMCTQGFNETFNRTNSAGRLFFTLRFSGQQKTASLSLVQCRINQCLSTCLYPLTSGDNLDDFNHTHCQLLSIWIAVSLQNWPYRTFCSQLS